MSELKGRYEIYTNKHLMKVSTYSFTSETGRDTEHLNASKLIRKSPTFTNFDPMQVEELRFTPNADQPIVFEELSYTENSITESGSGTHLIILVHGYQGNSLDMGLFKNYLQLAYPKTVVFSSTANENFPDASIAEQAERFAFEVLSHIEQAGLENRLGKLSFLGHSMGGLVIRAALPYFERFSNQMHSYISLSTPHLGAAGKSNKLVGIGIWFLKKWNKSTSLRQLSMTDAPERSQAYLFELSTLHGLNWFRYVVLLSSHQDSYAPFESARIECSPKTTKDSSLGRTSLQMAENILIQLQHPQLLRLDINFSLKKRNIDSMIGRKAHIQFLENESLVRTLVFAYSQFFI